MLVTVNIVSMAWCWRLIGRAEGSSGLEARGSVPVLAPVGLQVRYTRVPTQNESSQRAAWPSPVTACPTPHRAASRSITQHQARRGCGLPQPARITLHAKDHGLAKGSCNGLGPQGSRLCSRPGPTRAPGLRSGAHAPFPVFSFLPFFSSFRILVAVAQLVVNILS